MTEHKIMINGIDVSECNYAIFPKKQSPMKSMPYAKETSCIACKEHNTKHNFCKNNPNCNFKQLKRKEQKLEKIKILAKRDKELAKRYGEVDTLARVVLQIIEGKENE